MDLPTIASTELIGGIVALIAGIAYARKKFSFDNLEITKSETERELITILREQMQSLDDDLVALRERYNQLQDKTHIIGRERDEAIQERDMIKSDLARCELKITSLEHIVNSLTDALEFASAELKRAMARDEQEN